MLLHGRIEPEVRKEKAGADYRLKGTFVNFYSSLPAIN
jgi:hypothetical protein